MTVLRKVFDSTLFLLGIFIFTYFITGIHTLIPVAIAGIFISVLMVSRNIKSISDFAPNFGFQKWSSDKLLYIGIGILGGGLLAMMYRQWSDQFILPQRFVPFAFIAVAIGATEELIFRGYLQTQVAKVNKYYAILFSSFAHAAYKLVLFWSLQSDLDGKILKLLISTIIVGIIIGSIKEISKSTWVAIAFHVVFDLIVYGDRIIAPWWIW